MTKTKLKITMLSFSMLVVLSDAAISPTLGKIAQAFPHAPQATVQLILTIPGLLIVLTGFLFPFISKKLDVQKLAIMGLLFYTLGGVAGAFAPTVGALLFTRMLVGIGVGFIMPLSTGLLAYYFDMAERRTLMGYTVAMNNFGGIIGMVVAGYLAAYSYRSVFFIFLLGLVSLILAFRYIPQDIVKTDGAAFDKKEIKKAIRPLLSAALMMIILFVYMTNFAMIVAKTGQIPAESLGFIMAAQPIGALIIGLGFGRLDALIGNKLRMIGPLFFIIAYVLLIRFDSAPMAVLALFFLGAGLGTCDSFFFASASQAVSHGYVANIMAMMAIATYVGLFISPLVVNGVMNLFHIEMLKFPYFFAIGAALLLMLINLKPPKNA